MSIKLLLIAMMTLVGCSGVAHKSVPLKDLVHSISKEKYEKRYNDCSNMSAKYFHAAKAIGYDPTIIVYITRVGELHAIVQIKDTYVDCTTGRSTLFKPSNIVLELKEEDLSKYNDEYKVR